VRILRSAAVVLALVCGGLVWWSFEVEAYKEGPFPNMTGGFGEPTCRHCHLDNKLNAPGGTLVVNGIPPRYTTGETYPITITLSREGMRRGGFEISSRFASGSTKGKQAGEWRGLDQRMQLIRSQIDPSLFFVQHNTVGSLAPARGTNAWTIQWVAPAAKTPVQFNIAGNASNDDASALGDFIYTKAVRSEAAR